MMPRSRLSRDFWDTARAAIVLVESGTPIFPTGAPHIHRTLYAAHNSVPACTQCSGAAGNGKSV